jgi:hypothetical protein
MRFFVILASSRPAEDCGSNVPDASVGADTSQADGHPEFHAAKANDLHLVRIGNEGQEIPDAVVPGG